jgi:hypothetical protein
MFTRKKKIGSELGETKPENRLLRSLRLDIGSQACPFNLGRTDQEDTYSEAQKEARNAVLEAEYKKGKAIMMVQQHQNLR